MAAKNFTDFNSTRECNNEKNSNEENLGCKYIPFAAVELKHIGDIYRHDLYTDIGICIFF